MASVTSQHISWTHRSGIENINRALYLFKNITSKLLKRLSGLEDQAIAGSAIRTMDATAPPPGQEPTENGSGEHTASLTSCSSTYRAVSLAGS